MVAILHLRSLDLLKRKEKRNLWNLQSDGSFITAFSKLVPESLGNIPIARDILIFGIIMVLLLYYIDTGMLCILIRIASERRFL